MVFIVYVAPNFTENAVRFINTLSQLDGIRFGLVSQEPLEWLPHNIIPRIADFERVSNVFLPGQLEQAIRILQSRQGAIHRIIAAVEQVQIPAAQVRESLGIQGMTVETISHFRDKGLMKEKFRAAGIPCARYLKAGSYAEASSFCQDIGFPVIAKPPDGAASQNTHIVKDEKELALFFGMNTISHDQPILLEEFITGTEHSFDTFTQKAVPVFHSLTHYYPNPIEVVREPWIQWQVLLPLEIEAPVYDDIRSIAFRTLEVLNMDYGLSHLEWFRRPDGSVAVSEIAARPPGAQITTLISRANDMDCIAAWGKLLIFGIFEPVERRYACGGAYLRGMGEGRVKSVEGLDRLDPMVRDMITDARIPSMGTEKSKSYEGEGYILIRHKDTALVKEALEHIVSTVRIVLS